MITGDGPKVFNGDNRLPHKLTDFVPTDSYKGLSKNVRNVLQQHARRLGVYNQRVRFPPHTAGCSADGHTAEFGRDRMRA